MDFTSLIQLLLPFQEQFSKFSLIISLVITAIVVLWVFNLVAGFIQRTYSFGKTCGKIYRNYFHSHFRRIFIQVSALFSSREKETINYIK
tara:strand:- start:66100 stop:66369 length:270 start_codon:yes stop_codon:yes gene_type:complete